MYKGMIFGKETRINSDFKFKGCTFGDDILVEEGVFFNVIGGHIGSGTIIRSGARVEGNSVVLGRESYLDHGAHIGGGSCMDEGAFLNAGDWFHMGENSQVNIARGVEAGHEVGVGIETKIFTHGAYLPADMGFPVQWAPVKIGHRVWLPNAWVNPGVTIGDNVVVAARSLINRDLPAGCLAGGTPAIVLKENTYPRKWSLDDYDGLMKQLPGTQAKQMERTVVLLCGETIFDITGRTIEGPVTADSERVKNQLRRNGIRFRFSPAEGVYKAWN